MTASLTRSWGAAYRSHVGAESVPMGIWKSSPLHCARTAPRLIPSAVFCFLWSGERISPRGLAGTPCAGSFQIPLRPATKGIWKCSGGRLVNRPARSLAMLESRLCCCALARGRAL